MLPRNAVDASILKKNAGYATVVNTGSRATQVGADARTGSIWSGGRVTLAPRATIDGFIKSAAGIQRDPGAVVVGATDGAGSLAPLRESTWQVKFPPNTGGNVDIQPSVQRSLPPGGYGTVSVKSGATLILSSGTYGMEALTVEPNAKVIVDDAVAPVVGYVRGIFTFRGRVQKQSDTTSTKPQWLVVAFGGASIEAPFKGTVVTPNATLALQPLNGAGEHYGAFFGRDVNVEAGVIIHHRPFLWSTILPPVETAMGDAPVILKPSLTGDPSDNEPGANVTESTSSTPIDFEVPRDIWVSNGNAGKGTLRFSFRTGSGSTTVCTYRGGSSVTTPTRDLDVAKGRRYLLTSCTNGYAAGQSATGTWFSVEIVSSAPNFKETAVDLQLGRGCSGSLPPPMTPEEVVALRDNFDWRTMGSLSETDPDSNPALWHGMIYIDHKEQLQALDRWRVYWSAIPFSSQYMNDLVGKCGRVEHATDGKGVVVYAIFPAKLFNILRTFSIEAALKGAEPPFKFLIPSTPNEPDFTNVDGSIKYSALVSSGYHKWLATRAEQLPSLLGFVSSIVNTVTEPVRDAVVWIDDNIIDPATDVVESGFSYVGSAWDSFVDWTANAIDNTWETIQVGLGNIIEAFKGTIHVTLDVDISSRDKFIKGPMTCAWGPNDASGRRPKLVPNGVFVSIRQWGWGIVPVLNQERLPADGHVVVEAVEGGEGRGGDALCLELENDAALMTSDWIPNEVCDFYGPNFDDFEHDTVNHLVTDQKDLHALTQFTDGADYMRTVAEFEPKQFTVLIGWAATNMTKLVNGPGKAISADQAGEARAMTLCLDFPSVGSAAITRIGSFLGGFIGMTAASLWQKDLWWPDDNDSSTDSRGVATHEYGHFAMCNLLFDKASGFGGLGGPTALTGLMARVSEGADGEQRSDVAGVVTESWADTFAMQVTGGTNDVHADQSTDVGTRSAPYAMGFCTRPDCMEFNYGSTAPYLNAPDGSSQYHDEIAKVLSTIHDAFDSSTSGRRFTNQPSNGDVWAWNSSSTLLVPASSGYVAVADERVSLTGHGWQTWVEKWLSRGGDVDYRDYLGALSDAMEAQGNSWCKRCEVFAIHETGLGRPSTYVTSDFSTLHDRWSSCLSGSLAEYVGGPPEPYLNVDSGCQACAPHEFADGGSCTPCAAGEVARGTSCMVCPAGTVPEAGSNECIGCAGNEVSENGVCVPCDVGRFADHDANVCAICPADATVDVSTLITCGQKFVDTTSSAAVDDPCPNDYWLEVSHLEAAETKGCGYLDLSAVPSSTDTEGECSQRDVQMSVFDPSFTKLYGNTSRGFWIEDTSDGDGGLDLDGSFCFYFTRHHIDGADLPGLGTVRARVAATQDVGPGGLTDPWPAIITVGVGDAPPPE